MRTVLGLSNLSDIFYQRLRKALIFSCNERFVLLNDNWKKMIESKRNESFREAEVGSEICKI
jgi:hypothetical protein